MTRCRPSPKPKLNPSPKPVHEPNPRPTRLALALTPSSKPSPEQVLAKELENQEIIKKMAEQKKQEQEYLAAAKIATAKGDSAKTIIRATAEAQSIKIKQQQLKSSSQYIEYLKAQKWDGKMPQVVGSGGLIIDLKK